MYHVLHDQLDPYGLMSSNPEIAAIQNEISRLRASGVSENEIARRTNGRIQAISRQVNRKAAIRQIQISAKDRAGKSLDFAQGYFIDAPEGMIRV